MKGISNIGKSTFESGKVGKGKPMSLSEPKHIVKPELPTEAKPPTAKPKKQDIF